MGDDEIFDGAERARLMEVLGRALGGVAALPPAERIARHGDAIRLLESVKDRGSEALRSQFGLLLHMFRERKRALEARRPRDAGRPGAGGDAD